MTELEIKVVAGKLYFPKDLNKIFQDNQKIITWFCTGKYSSLLSKLGLSHKEIDNLVSKSNQFVIVEDHDKFLSFLQKDVKMLASKNDKPALTYAKYLRGICRYCADYEVGSTTSVSAPKIYTNFNCGSFILISYEHNNSVATEIWEKEVWEKIKSYLIEKKKLKKKDITLYKYKKPGYTDEEIRDLLNKSGL